MRIKISWRDLVEEMRPILEIQKRRFFDDGKGLLVMANNWHALDAHISAYMASESARLFEATGEEEYKDLAQRLVKHWRLCQVKINGIWVQDKSNTVNITEYWRDWGEMYFVSRILKDDTLLEFLREIILSWPYIEEKQRFAQILFVPLGRETHVEPVPVVVNMLADALVPAWIVGNETHDEKLIQRAEETLESVVYSYQRKDGLWPYNTRDSYISGHYTGYTMFVLIRLLRWKRWQNDSRFVDCMRRGFSALKERWHNLDGSFAFPGYVTYRVVNNDSGMSAYIAWVLHKYLDDDLSEVAAAAAWWAMTFKPKPEQWCLDALFQDQPISCLSRFISYLITERVEGEFERPSKETYARTFRKMLKSMEVGDQEGSRVAPAFQYQHKVQHYLYRQLNMVESFWHE